MNAALPLRLPAEQHSITAERTNPKAVEVVQVLRDAGFEAYLVGGCVRDLLLGVEPKDFDVATNATPEEIKGLFRRARTVGRRFRIVHVRFGRELIEVSTFRKIDDDALETDDDGMILRDNVFGSLEEDAFRRDFTVNALYYDPLTEEVIDFVGGLVDLEARRLQFIGDTQTRLAEDPVRLLRALRFSAKLEFALSDEISAHADAFAERLESISSARLFEEFNKLFLSGHAEQVWAVLRESVVCRYLFPTTDPSSGLIELAMRSTDDRIREEKPVTPGFLVAVMLWEDYLARRISLEGQRSPKEAAAFAAYETLEEQQELIAIPRRYGQFIRDVWLLQDQLEHREDKKAIARTYQHERFRAAYDFLMLRAELSEQVEEAARWWTKYQESGNNGQPGRQQGKPRDDDSEGGRGRRRRRRGRNPDGEQAGGRGQRESQPRNRRGNNTGNSAGAQGGNNASNASGNSAENGDDAPKRRRRRSRRRKKPAEGQSQPTAGQNGQSDE